VYDAFMETFSSLVLTVSAQREMYLPRFADAETDWEWRVHRTIAAVRYSLPVPLEPGYQGIRRTQPDMKPFLGHIVLRAGVDVDPTAAIDRLLMPEWPIHAPGARVGYVWRSRDRHMGRPDNSDINREHIRYPDIKQMDVSLPPSLVQLLNTLDAEGKGE